MRKQSETYISSDYGVFCGINAGLLKMEQDCLQATTLVDGIIPHKSSLFKRGGRNVVVEVIMSVLLGQTLCVVVSSLP